MKLRTILCAMAVFMLSVQFCSGEQKKPRIFIVSSYHREYLWSQDTDQGVCQALIDFGILDNQQQADEFTKNDFIETDKLVMKKEWMDTKHRYARSQLAEVTTRILREINDFKPDIILLGDDNAANYIGTQFVDTDIPVVFWGIDGIPIKYGLLDTVEHPGHNVTGIYQTPYVSECLHILQQLIPAAKTFAILSDDSETGRAKAKYVEELGRNNRLPLKLAATIITNSYAEWQSQTLAMQDKVDAFLVLNHNTLKDGNGNPVEQMTAGAWYLATIRKPECATEKQFVQEGMLLVVDDSGFKQGYEAARLAFKILKEGKKPAELAAYAPSRGAVILNRQRAKTLGIDIANASFIEEFIDSSAALENGSTKGSK